MAFSPTPSAGTAVLEYGATEILPPVVAILNHPARLCRPGRQTSRAQPRGKPGFSTLESSSGRETDSPLEGTGFEPSVPRDTTNLSSRLWLVPANRKSQRKRTDTRNVGPFPRGTDGSNPVPSGESGANLIFRANPIDRRRLGSAIAPVAHVRRGRGTGRTAEGVSRVNHGIGVASPILVLFRTGVERSNARTLCRDRGIASRRRLASRISTILAKSASERVSRSIL